MIKDKPYKVCIFCGSKSGKSSKYIRLANKLGVELAKKNFTIIYGGGNSGLMGALSTSFVERRGKLVSVIPKYFKKKNILTNKSEKIIWTKNFSDRKSFMINSADIFIALPGGYGTLDELIEVISLNQLKVINKKLIIIDINNFWKPFKILIKDLKNKGFLYTNSRNNIFFRSSVNKTIAFIENNL